MKITHIKYQNLWKVNELEIRFDKQVFGRYKHTLMDFTFYTKRNLWRIFQFILKLGIGLISWLIIPAIFILFYKDQNYLAAILLWFSLLYLMYSDKWEIK